MAARIAIPAVPRLASGFLRENRLQIAKTSKGPLSSLFVRHCWALIGRVQTAAVLASKIPGSQLENSDQTRNRTGYHGQTEMRSMAS